MDGPPLAADTGSLARASPDEDADLAASWVVGDEAAGTAGVATVPAVPRAAASTSAK